MIAIYPNTEFFFTDSLKNKKVIHPLLTGFSTIPFVQLQKKKTTMGFI
jgi:hypothetical protein